jgi:RHS repeat-associated protein
MWYDRSAWLNSPFFIEGLMNLRLPSSSADARGPQTFAFDAAGNRSTQTFDGQARSYDHTNPLNQLEGFSGALGTASFGHDAEGNRISRTLDGQGTGYAWDGKNRLAKVTLPDTTVINYTYDYQNRRVKRVQGSETRGYLYGSGYEVLEEFINGQSLALNAWGPAGLASRTDAQGQTLFYLKDGLGSVLAIMDEKAGIIQSYEYSAFGETLSGQDAVNSFRFVGGFGGQVDDATGLVYFWNRWYDPQVGRWVSEDPIRWDSDNANMFGYAGNGPVGYFDPAGLKKCDVSVPASPVWEVALMCFGEGSKKSQCGSNAEWANEKRAITDVVYNRVAANKSYWGGNTVMGVLAHPGQFVAYNGREYIRAQKNWCNLAGEDCDKIKECVSAASASAKRTVYGFNGFNQTSKPGRTKMGVHYFRTE